MTKTSTQTTPGAERAASPRRSAPEAILEQCLDNGRAGMEHGGKDGPQAGVEVQFTARQCVPTALDGSQVIERRPRSKTPPESLRGPIVRRSGRPGWLPGRPRASRSPRHRPRADPARIESGGRLPRPQAGTGWQGWKYQNLFPGEADRNLGARIESGGRRSVEIRPASVPPKVDPASGLLWR